MELKNDYKIIYSSQKDGALHLYATKFLPEETDIQVTYKNETGAILTIDEIKEIKLVYSKVSEKGVDLYYTAKNIPAEDDHKLLVYSGAGKVQELVLGNED